MGIIQSIKPSWLNVSTLNAILGRAWVVSSLFSHYISQSEQDLENRSIVLVSQNKTPPRTIFLDQTQKYSKYLLFPERVIMILFYLSG